MADFVINEWLWSDLSGDNGPDAQRETFYVIERFPKSDHRMVFIEGSAFDQKAWSLCKHTSPTIVQRIGGVFVTSVRQNSDHCLILKPGEVVVLPDNLASATKLDDHYLLQAQLTARGSILVTTDADLYEVVNKAALPCLSRKEFLD